MKSIIVGTAGHIDHGKTALVKTLTGIDADRLEEEKRRGITIDLGFAHLELPGANGEILRFGFVDVPGHERFVRNMLAGIGGIDMVLLVIAADEAIKPQTREHFDICRLLGVQHGIIVLTKSDVVDTETLEVVRLEIEDYLRGSFLDQAPVIAVSSLKRTGLEELKRELARIAGQISTRDSKAIVRLPIDRVFTMKGFGTVVTGTLVAGTIRKEDELQLFPSGKKVRIRGVQVHGKNEERAIAGERTALNLAGVEKHELERGMVLASPNLLQTSARIDVQLSLLPSAKPLKTRARVHFHAFASETIATVQLYESAVLKPGNNAFAQLRLAAPVLLVPGDRFIIRQFSPVITIGGGVVLENKPPSRVRNVETYVDLLKVLGTESREEVMRARVTSQGTQGLSTAEAVARTGWTKVDVESVAGLIPEITNVGGTYILNFALNVARKGLLQILDSFHKQNPLAGGMPRENLRERLAGIAPEVFSVIFDEAIRNKHIVISGDLVHLPDRGVVMKDEEAESRKIIEQAFASAGLKVPALKDVLAGLKIDKLRAQKLVTLLLRERILIKVSDDLVFHHSAVADLRKTMADQKTRSPKIDVGRFKDLTGVTRKYAIPLLEYLDRERVTKRVGDERVIL
ncbi:MAG TPA: selenocysteine-specific translation elongation factor [Candidatus Sulfotelmatobacter sp.]|nr:selenocysteine-specific translation elongation factor [Candidatus Sulfotelmatobacter sp.]